jgi:hypothetical protein
MAETATTHTGNGRAPEAPTDLSKSTWKGTLRRTFKEFREDCSPQR